MMGDQSDDVLNLKQQLAAKNQEILRIREDINLLEDSLDEQEQKTKDVKLSLQNRIDTLTNDIEDKDEQIDALLEEIETLRKNDSISPVGGVSDCVVETLKTQMQQKDGELKEMKEKLNKGGMTINNLHMEIREMKEDMSSLNEKIAEKSKKIKEMRDENTTLKSTISELKAQLNTRSDVNIDDQASPRPSNIVQVEVFKREIDSKNEELVAVKKQLAKLTKQGTDSDMNPHIGELQHSKERKHSTPDSDSLLNSRTKELEEQLEKSKSDFRKAIIALIVLCLAFLLPKFM